MLDDIVRVACNSTHSKTNFIKLADKRMGSFQDTL